MFKIQGMSSHDVNLRCSGSWVVVNGVPEYIREVFCRDEEHDDGSFSCTVHDAAVGFDTTRRVIPVQSLELTAPSTGYCTYDNECVYVARQPERQSRTGLPVHSTVVTFGEGTGGDRLGGLPAGVQAAVANGMYIDRKHTDLFAALSSAPGAYSITDSLAVAVHGDKSGTLFGPAYTPLGTVTLEGDEVRVRTQHPHAVSNLLGGMYG